MKKVSTLVMAFLVLAMLSGCGSKISTARSETPVDENEGADSVPVSIQDNTEDTADDTSDNMLEDTTDNTETGSLSGTLVVYFSRAGENYRVGVVDKGNTAIVADMITDQMNADEFEIVPVNPYPEDYDDMLAIAQQEADENVLPEYQGDVENWDAYDTIFIGYPIWYGDMPRIMYTFLANHDWTGKTVIPFDTNGGSGLAQTKSTIANETGAEVLDGLAVPGTDAQKNQDSVREDVQSWLEGLGLYKTENRPLSRRKIT